MAREAAQVSREDRLTRMMLAGLIGTALAVRVWGVDFGLPHLYHVDEWQLVTPALRILHTQDLNPHRFAYGSLQIYLLVGLYGLYFLYGRSRGLFTTIQDIPFYDYHDIRFTVDTYPYPGIYISGRLLTALLGTLTLIVVYLAGRRMLDRELGLIASVILAFTPLHAINSHYITTDVPATLFLTLSFFFAVRALQRGMGRDYALSGLLAGMASSTKYPGGIAIVALITGHLLRQRQTFEGRKLVTGLLAGAFGFLIGTPFALLDLKT